MSFVMRTILEKHFSNSSTKDGWRKINNKPINHHAFIEHCLCEPLLRALEESKTDKTPLPTPHTPTGT